MRANYYLCVFKGINSAIAVFDVLEDNERKKFQLIPTPCRLKAGCNYSIKFYDIAYLRIIKNIRRQLQIEMPRIYSVSKGEGTTDYKEINA